MFGIPPQGRRRGSFSAPDRKRCTTLALVLLFELVIIASGCASLSASDSQRNPSPSQTVQPIGLTANFPPAVVGSAYEGTVTVHGGKAPYSFRVIQGSLPHGLLLDNATGAISGTPQVLGSYSFLMEVTDHAGTARGQKSLGIAVKDKTPNPLTVQGSALPAATEGSSYATSLSASGGTSPYSWSITAGLLPKGLLIAADGSLSGSTTATGSFTFTAKVSDASQQSASASFSLSVTTSQQTGTFDGPAELPRVYMQTAMADTPAPGTTRSVSTAAELHTAIQSASCGDTLLLKAGASFEGMFIFPAKPCDDNHWIIVRTSAPDNLLPAEGTRLTPCYAGVASLPGRPSFNCSSVQNVTARMAANAAGEVPILLQNGANHYRFIGLEITREVPQTVIFDLASNVTAGASDHIIYDRVWMHGTAQDETNRGISLIGSTYVAVIDSFFTDFHCIAVTGACGDSQAIAGGLGDLAQGPYKIVDNFLEASGENIIFGGGPATQTPTDIEIRRNYLFKPLTWMRGRPGYVGGRNGRPFIVKNHFELKNGIRVLFDGNVLENTWGGFSQSGFSILLTPKNQSGLCPLCVVHDITLRYSTISNAAGAIAISNGKSDSGALSLGAWNQSLHDLLITSIDGAAFGGGNYMFIEASNNPRAILHDVTINHVTALTSNPSGALLVVSADVSYPRLSNFNWTNSIFAANGSGIVSAGGGPTNCAFGKDGAVGVLKRCFNPYSFSHNVLIGPVLAWPTDNFPTLTDSHIFGSGKQGGLSQYELDPSSPYKNTASDGTDPGANIPALETAIAGVN